MVRVAKRARLATDARREQLLEVGLEFFGTKPYGDVSTAELARGAGVSHGLLFHYFGDKRGYYLAVLDWVARRLLRAQGVGDEAGPVDRLRSTLAARVDFADRYTIAYRALVSGGNGADDDVAELCENARWEGIRLILDALDVADPGPELRIALRGWAGFTEGAIIEWLKRRDLSRDELVQLLVHELIDTLHRAEVDLSKVKRAGE
jgi:AcrR family transcriptional regulator